MVIVTPLLCTLGFWQLDRAEQKRTEAAALDMRRKQPAITLADSTPVAADQLRYRNVQLQSKFIADKTILIANRKYLGKSGFHVVTPLQLSDTGGVVLINRGWIEAAPSIHSSVLKKGAEPSAIAGEIRIPQAPAIELTPVDDNGDSIPHWPYQTLDRYRQWSGLEILPFLVLQTSEDDLALMRQWPTPKVSDLMHIGYAIQWFAFAVIALLVWLRLSFQQVVHESP
jgi:surfeit locus 1 family protein